MYEERKMKFNWKGFILKLLIILLILVLVLKFVPLGNKKDTNGHSRVFNKNLTTFKEVGSNYFNKDNLPKDDKGVKVTLRQLIKNKKIDTLKGSDKKVCNEDASYIKSFKKDIGYALEVYLECGEEKETSVIYLGCFDDCNVKPTTTKKTTTTKKKTTTKKSGSKVDVTTKRKTTIAPTTTRVKTFAVIFNENGGSKVKTQYVVINNKIVKPADPTREGFKFIGWFLNNELFDFNKPITENVVLMAKWEIADNKGSGEVKNLKTISEVVYSVVNANTNSTDIFTKAILNIPESIKTYDNIRIKSISYIRNFNNQDDINKYLNLRSTSFRYEEGFIDNTYTLANFGLVDNVEIVKINNSDKDYAINWNANSTSTCQIVKDNTCAYGIIYRVIWEYEA